MGIVNSAWGPLFNNVLPGPAILLDWPFGGYILLNVNGIEAPLVSTKANGWLYDSAVGKQLVASVTPILNGIPVAAFRVECRSIIDPNFGL